MSLPAAERPVVCISQARMGSTRLPGKIMLPALGRPLLFWHLSRLRRARAIDRLVVATTHNAEDDAVVELCRSLDVDVFRGSETNVLARYAGAARHFGAATIIRVTSDCPLIDPALVDRVAAAYAAGRPALAYASLDTGDYPRGLDSEIFGRAVLDEADGQSVSAAEREHVTPYIYRRPERFRCLAVGSGEKLEQHRWCVDEPADYELVQRIIETLAPVKPDFTWRDCLDLLAAHPDWAALNRSVAQKSVS
jgi:spore coat polysaccharide biosynthesis protein SpsF